MASPWLNYHHLFYFKTIAEESSVSRAAVKLRLGQPTLSAQLRQFEEAIEVQLFERQHKRLILTEQGKVALDYAKSIFGLGSEMLEVLHSRTRPSKLVVSVGALDDIPKQVMVQLVRTVLKIGPCQIALREGNQDELLRELAAHKIDLLLTNFVPTALTAKGLQHRLLSKQSVSVFAVPKYKALRKGFPQSVAGQPFILPSYDSRLRYDIDHWALVNNIDLEVLIESQDTSVKNLMALNGMGLVVASANAVAGLVRDGELIELGPLKGVSEELYLVSARRKIVNPIAKSLMAGFTL